jgi:hypothetical protein
LNVFGAAVFAGGVATGTEEVLLVIDTFFAASRRLFSGD